MFNYHKKINRKRERGRKLWDGKPKDMVLSKLREAFEIGATDEEACVYADIAGEERVSGTILSTTSIK